MKNTRIPKLVYEYIAAGRRNTERPRKDGETNTPEALSTYTQWLIIIIVVIIIIIVVIVIVIMKKKMMMMVMVMTVQVYVSF
jgi:t-SNARE complex subunit (syntaxin)